MPPGRSLRITVRQVPASAVGRTHASSVIPVVRSSEAASLIETRWVPAVKLSAEPNLPAADHVAPVIVPVLPLPERSASVVPLPASMLYAATGPAPRSDADAPSNGPANA